MPQVKFWIQLFEVGNTTYLSAVGENIAFSRFLSPGDISTDDDVATWLLSQLDNPQTTQNTSRQGIFTIDYHMEDVDDGDGGTMSVRVLDPGGVSKTGLPTCLGDDITTILSSFDTITDAPTRTAVKDLAKSIFILNSIQCNSCLK
jgi:hypothetical protein